jgi:hypothetical protein
VLHCNERNKPLTSVLPPQISLAKLELLYCNLWRARYNRSKFKTPFFILSATFYIIFCSVYVGEGRRRSTVIVIATMLWFGRSGPGISLGTRYFLVSKKSRPSLEPPRRVRTAGSFLGVKRLKLEVNHPLLYSAEFGNEWSYTSTPSTRLYDLDKENVNLCRSFILFVPCIVNSFIILAPKKRNSIYWILLLISSHTFWRNSHTQGTYTNVVKTYSNKLVLQWSCMSNVQVSFKIYR